MQRPNFFLIGAPKAGTTSFARYLGQHPSVFISPIKEPSFFAPEVVDITPHARALFEADAAPLAAYLDSPMRERRDHGIVLGWPEYLKLFKHVRDETAVGEASVSYLGSLGAPSAIRERIPHARILALLRDPADRLFAHYAASRATEATDLTFNAWIDEQIASEAKRHPPQGAFWAGRYALHLERYRASFPVSQIMLLLYDDYELWPGRVVSEVFTFLGLEARALIDTSRRHNVTTVPRWPAASRLARRKVPTLMGAMRQVPGAGRVRDWLRVPSRLTPTVAERARAIDLYRDDITAAARALGRDLSAWRDPTRD